MTDKRRMVTSLTVAGEKIKVTDETKIVGHIACEICKGKTDFNKNYMTSSVYQIAVLKDKISIYSSHPICNQCANSYFGKDKTND